MVPEAIRKQKRGAAYIMQQLGKENEIEKELVELFSQYDTDGDGFIDQNELAGDDDRDAHKSNM